MWNRTQARVTRCSAPGSLAHHNHLLRFNNPGLYNIDSQKKMHTNMLYFYTVVQIVFTFVLSTHMQNLQLTPKATLVFFFTCFRQFVWQCFLAGFWKIFGKVWGKADQRVGWGREWGGGCGGGCEQWTKMFNPMNRFKMKEKRIWK